MAQENYYFVVGQWSGLLGHNRLGAFAREPVKHFLYEQELMPSIINRHP